MPRPVINPVQLNPDGLQAEAPTPSDIFAQIPQSAYRRTGLIRCLQGVGPDSGFFTLQ